MSGQRWRVPYSAPGSKGGSVTVTATSREDAYLKVAALHRQTRRFPRSEADRANGATMRLTQAQTRRIEYGEPELIDSAEQRVQRESA